MKKALFLVLLLSSGLFLYGCGAGGGTTSSSNGNTPISTPVGSAGGFTLYLVDGADSLKGNAIAGFTVAGTAQVATNVRVVIRQFSTSTTPTTICSYDDNGDVIPGSCNTVNVTTTFEVYRDIQDIPYPATGSSVQVGIPASTNPYTLDIITSKLETGNNHSIVKYGQLTNLMVVPNASASVTMNTVNDILKMTVADSVVSKGIFNVTLNNVLPFSPNYKMSMGFADGITSYPTSTVSAATNVCTFSAPTSFNTGTVSLQGQFTLHPSLLLKNEPPAQWTRLFPNAAYGEQVYSNLIPLIAVIVPIN